MIEASQVKVAQTRRLASTDAEQLTRIEAEIMKVSTETFNDYIYWDSYISDNNIKELQNAGYIVIYCGSIQEGDVYKISW